MCKHVVKKLPYLLRYAPNQYKTQQISDKAILESGGTLKSLPNCRENKEMCNEAVDNYPHALEFVPDCYITQKPVIKLSIFIHLQYNLFLNAINIKKYVIKLLIIFYCIVLYS